MFDRPLSLTPPVPAARREPLSPAWRALLGEEAPREAADEPWACSSFHASSWDLRDGLEVEEHEWIEAEIPPQLEGALQFV